GALLPCSAPRCLSRGERGLGISRVFLKGERRHGYDPRDLLATDHCRLAFRRRLRAPGLWNGRGLLPLGGQSDSEWRRLAGGHHQRGKEFHLRSQIFGSRGRPGFREDFRFHPEAGHPGYQYRIAIIDQGYSTKLNDSTRSISKIAKSSPSTI